MTQNVIGKNVSNPFGESKAKEVNGLVEAESQRAIQEVQAAIIVAKKFPRDPQVAMEGIINACTRKTLAEGALYSYNKGGTEVSGPSIRLAETLAQSWGNFQCGIRELSQQNGISSVEAFAWDIENNLRVTKTFQVSHVRYSKSRGNTILTDPRDIYEKVANDGARRLRACILAVIPSDVVEAAVHQCNETLTANADTSSEAIKKLVATFKTFKVTPEMLQKRIGNKIESIRPAQLIGLRKIYISLKDDMSKVSDWFDDSVTSSTIDTINKQVTDISVAEEVNPEAEPEVSPEIIAKAEELFGDKK